MDKILDLYSDYLIAQNQYATAVRLSDLLEGRISKEFASRELWEHIKPEIRKIEQDTGGVLILDDTIGGV